MKLGYLKCILIRPYLLLVLIFFWNCSRRENLKDFEPENAIIIDLLKEGDLRIDKVSHIASDINYIPLETSEECIIRFINKVIFKNEKIFVKSGSEIICFSKDGRYLYKLSDSGRGPGQYNYIRDFDISDDGKLLFLLSDSKVLIHSISEKDFLFKSSFRLNHPVPFYLSVVPGTTNILLSVCPWLGVEETLNLIVSEQGDTLAMKKNIYKYKKSDAIKVMSLWDAMQYRTGSLACFKEVFSDTVFSVNCISNDIKPYIVFDSHGNVVNTNFRSDPDYSISHRGDFSQVAFMSEVERYIFFHCFIKGERHNYIYDKKEMKKYETDLEKNLEDDIGGGPPIVFNQNSSSQGLFYSYHEAMDFIEYMNSTSFRRNEVLQPKLKEQLLTIAGSLVLTDNPVLVIITPKE